MHPRTREVLDHLDNARAALERAVAAVPEDIRSARPAPDSWSVSEIVEHLSLVESRVDALLLGHLQQARAAGLPAESDVSTAVSDAIVQDFVDRSQSRTAGPASQPTGLPLEESWSRLRAERATLRDVLTDADGLALGTIRITHARLGELDFYGWLAFLGAHELRHVAQINEAGAKLGA